MFWRLPWDPKILSCQYQRRSQMALSWLQLHSKLWMTTAPMARNQHTQSPKQGWQWRSQRLWLNLQEACRWALRGWAKTPMLCKHWSRWTPHRFQPSLETDLWALFCSLLMAENGQELYRKLLTLPSLWRIPRWRKMKLASVPIGIQDWMIGPQRVSQRFQCFLELWLAQPGTYHCLLSWSEPLQWCLFAQLHLWFFPWKVCKIWLELVGFGLLLRPCTGFASCSRPSSWWFLGGVTRNTKSTSQSWRSQQKLKGAGYDGKVLVSTSSR